MYKNFLSENLNYLIEKHRYNGSFLAEKLKVSSSAISNYAKGKRVPSADFVLELSSFFGISCDDLLKKDLSKENATETQESAKSELNSLQQTKNNLFKLISDDVATNKLFNSLISATMVQYFDRIEAIKSYELSEEVKKELKEKLDKQ